jgi:hypothetical protein
MSIFERVSDPRPIRCARQRRAFFALLLAAATLCGCARYDVTLTNGGKVTNVPKPVRSKEGGYYTIITPGGQKLIISSSRVVAIVPHGDKD